MILAEPIKTFERSLHLGASPNRAPYQVLQNMLSVVQTDTPAFGNGNLVTRFEDRTAELLGKEAAVLLPTGKMAQQIALRLHCEDTGRLRFAAHPTAHPVNYELDGYAKVHGLEYVPLGVKEFVPERADVERVAGHVGAVMWELPYRELGGLVPGYGDLIEQTQAARNAGAHTHLDGARIWEAQTYYQMPFDQIAAPFESVYVSLYKTLEGPRGAVLAGTQEFIDRAFEWAIRLGGESVGNWPLAAAGLYAYDNVLPLMPEYRNRARQISAALKEHGISTVPTDPQTPFFFVQLPVPAAAASKAHKAVAEEIGLELFRSLRPDKGDASCTFEVSVGAAAYAVSPEEIAETTSRVVTRAEQLSASIL